MKTTFKAFKKLVFLYFFALMPFGGIAFMLSFFSFKGFVLNILPIIHVGGFIGILLYTICFSIVFAFINWVANIISYGISIKIAIPEKQAESRLYVTYTKNKEVSITEKAQEKYSGIPGVAV